MRNINGLLYKVMVKIQLNLFENPQQFTITALREEDNPCFAFFQEARQKLLSEKGTEGIFQAFLITPELL